MKVKQIRINLEERGGARLLDILYLLEGETEEKRVEEFEDKETRRLLEYWEAALFNAVDEAEEETS